MEHAEDFATDVPLDEQYYEGYANYNVHRVMLADQPRLQFYKSILTDPAIVKGKVVVDIGSGSGVLSCWATQGGAAHVLSIEASSIAELQPAVFRENGVDEAVTVIHDTVERLVERGVNEFINEHPLLRVHGGVGLIVSEWMGFYLLHEGMLLSVLRGRDFFRAVNQCIGAGVELDMIPSSATLYAAPVSLRPFYREQFELFWSDVAGLRLGALAHAEYEARLEASTPFIESIPPSCLLHEGIAFWHASMATVREEECTSVIRRHVFRFAQSPIAVDVFAREGRLCVDGFTIWFDVCYGSYRLDTAPTAPATHWKQTTIVLPRHVREDCVVSFAKDDADDELGLTLTMEATDEHCRCYTIECELS